MAQGADSLAGVFTIPAGWPFVDVLAAGILAAAGTDPAALAAVTVLVPTRRAVRSLREAFLRLSDDKPLLLPRLMPLGDLDEDELAIAGGEEPALDAADVPPAIAGLRRQLLLTRLVQASQPMAIEQAAMLALELARLIDQVQTERLSFDKLAAIVPDEHAQHWQETLKFLAIVTQHWPNILRSEGAIDSAERRNRLLAAQARRWLQTPPPGPVIVAGSTGSIPATADLLAAIATLPNGAIVLPGFDPAIGVDVADAARADAQHPQHGMLHLLDRCGVAPAQVKPWPAAPRRAAPPARAALIAEALRPAATTHAWRGLAAPPAEAFAGLTRIDCPGAEEEARVIALLLRRTLQEEGRTAALVTPDRRLARRVAAELKRWHIEIDDSAGAPLAGTPVGAFLRLCAEVIAQDFAPIALLALGKHPLAGLGVAPAAVRRLVRALEIAVLRGPRPAPGIDGLRAALEHKPPEIAREPLALVDRIERAARPLIECCTRAKVPLSDLVAAHVRMAEALAASDDADGVARLWQGDAGEAAAAFIAEALEAAPVVAEIAPGSYPGLFDALIGGRVVRPRYGAHPRLSIWGLLEARLQQADEMILGGLNEGTWPPEAEADPWMSRPMRAAFGLPPPERRIGLTAHDFQQACTAREVVLTRAERVDGSPTVPARWLVKLEKILTKFDIHIEGRPAEELLAWQAALDAPGDRPRIDSRPAPRPPVAARPRKLSVTQVETWMRDPYAIYARHILGLKELEPIDAAPDRADYGTIIHTILDDFMKEHAARWPADAFARLVAFGAERFDAAGLPPGVRAFWWPRFTRIARWFADSEVGRRIGLAAVASEVRGSLTFAGPAGPFELTAIADRIDRLDDGSLRVLDYKTGTLPSAREVAAGYAPQLPLEAAIAEAGGFASLAPARVASLAFVRLTGSDPAGELKPVSKDKDPADLAVDARVLMKGLIDAFDRPETVYESRPAPTFAPRYSAYEHLARVKEWAADDDGEGES